MRYRLYDHVSTMWYYEGWLPEASVEYARTHYAAYTVKRPDGLRVISLDTDMCTSLSLLGTWSTNHPHLGTTPRVHVCHVIPYRLEQYGDRRMITTD